MKVIVSVLSVLVSIVVAAVLLVYSGSFEVAAATRHSEFGAWLLHTAMVYSVKRKAASIQAPASDTRWTPHRAAHAYSEMCVPCHGAPGVKPDEVGEGLMPPAPDLAEAASAWSEQEVYWIIKNGVRFTGMPAWGATHSEQEIWDLARFVRMLPTMNAATYRETVGGELKRAHHHAH